MRSDTSNIKVAIGAKQFLYRLGIKTIINVIGVEPELFQCSNYDELIKTLLHFSEIEFLVINEDIIPQPKAEHLEKIQSAVNNCQILYIGEKPVEGCNCSHFAIGIESQKEMTDRFMSFFFDPPGNDKEKNDALLSEREIEVLKSVAHGMANKEIADKLSISTNTVITHRKNITEKLGIKTIAGLTVYAVLNNVINPEDVKQ